jgi:hypothetical protein
VTATKALNKTEISKSEYQALLEKVTEAYIADMAENEYETTKVKEFLTTLQDDLAKVEEQHAKIVRAAHKSAGMKIGVGFLGCLSQLGGFGYCIYFISDWNTMEPITWMVCKLIFLFILFRVWIYDDWLLFLFAKKN